MKFKVKTYLDNPDKKKKKGWFSYLINIFYGSVIPLALFYGFLHENTPKIMQLFFLVVLVLMVLLQLNLEEVKS